MLSCPHGWWHTVYLLVQLSLLLARARVPDLSPPLDSTPLPHIRPIVQSAARARLLPPPPLPVQSGQVSSIPPY